MGTATAIMAMDVMTNRAGSDLRNLKDMTTGATDSDIRALGLCYWFVGWVLPISTSSFPLFAWVRELAFIYFRRLGKGTRLQLRPFSLDIGKTLPPTITSTFATGKTQPPTNTAKSPTTSDFGKISPVELTFSTRRLKLSPLLRIFRPYFHHPATRFAKGEIGFWKAAKRTERYSALPFYPCFCFLFSFFAVGNVR